MPVMLLSPALVAATLFALLLPSVPLPAKGAMTPVDAVTLRTRNPSLIYRFPTLSAARPRIKMPALVAGPLSPQLVEEPFPATVEMVPCGVTFRTREFPRSQIYRLFAPSMARSVGALRYAPFAGPP